MTAFGKSFTANGFGNKMREWCDEAGLPECTSHGLRKLCLVRLAEAGLDAFRIAAISGHKDLCVQQQRENGHEAGSFAGLGHDVEGCSGCL